MGGRPARHLLWPMGMALLACVPFAAGACGKTAPREEPPDAATALDASDVTPGDAGFDSSIDADATAEAGILGDDCVDAGHVSTSADLTFPVSDPALEQWAPEVGFDGQNFLLAWSEDSPSGVGSSYASRVTPEGVVLDNPPTQLIVDGNVTSLAFNGTNYLVAWASSAAGNRGQYVLASRITPQGKNLDPTGIAISSSATSNRGTVACGAGTCLLVWADITNSQVKAVRIDATAGTVLDASPILLSTGMGGGFTAPVGVDFDGADYLAVWLELTGSKSAYPWAKIAPGGAVVSKGSALALPSLASGSGAGVSMAFGGSSHLFMWEALMADYSYSASRLDLDGAVLAPADVLLTTQGGQSMGVDFDGRRFLAMWTTAGESAMAGIRISPNGCIDPSPSLQIPGEDGGKLQFPQLASSGQGKSLVAFSQCDFSLANCLLHARVATSE
jgi:hypothetical protein